jgi:hypothetical protein
MAQVSKSANNQYGPRDLLQWITGNSSGLHNANLLSHDISLPAKDLAGGSNPAR